MNKTVSILGAGESGTGAALLAKAKGQQVFLSDAGSIKEKYRQVLEENEIEFEEGEHTFDKILNSDLIIKSPGIPDTAPLVKAANEKGIPVISEIEYAYRYTKARIIAITGTNGKTTTAMLTYHLLKESGLNVGLGGNIGNSFAAMVIEDPYDYIVLEVSSFQLDGIIDFKADIAVLLNITPDHLDRYEGSFQKYVNSKFKITQNQSAKECFIYFADSVAVQEEVKRRNIEASLFVLSLKEKNAQGAYMDQNHLVFNVANKAVSEYKVPTEEISLIGKHNMINTMASILSAITVGASISGILKAVKTFKAAEHRLERVEEVNGVTFINDSKATNVDAVYYALEGINKPLIWVAGGTDKGNDYEQIKSLVKDKVKQIVCLGIDNSRIISSFSGLSIPITETTTTDETVKVAFEVAQEGDVVLLSPACASFDLFKNYEDRGAQFKASVRKLKEQFGNTNNQVA